MDLTFFANFVVAGSAIVALLLNAYVAWGNSRDKSLELLGSIRGLVAELNIRSLYLEVNPHPTKRQIRVFQDACEGMANRIAESVGRAGAIIGEFAYKRAERLAAILYELSEVQLGEPPTTVEWKQFDELLKNAHAQGHEVQNFMSEDIENRFKLHHVIMHRVKRMLDSEPRKETAVAP
jgi:hypothetical protein